MLNMNAGHIVSVKTGFRGKTLNVTPAQFPEQIPNNNLQTTVNRRVSMGGRGREWMASTYNVLKEMASKEEVKVLMQPVDAIKHPEYYEMVSNPIDLSKIQLKFHSGCYSSIESFVNDMQLMFDNYLLIYKNEDCPIRSKLIEVRKYFDTTMEEIRKKFFLNNKMDYRSSLPKLLGERIDAIEAKNRNIVGMPFIIPASPPLTSISDQQPAPKKYVVRYPSDIASSQFKPSLITNCTTTNSSSTIQTSTSSANQTFLVRKPINVQLTTNNNNPKVLPTSESPSSNNGTQIAKKYIFIQKNENDKYIIMPCDTNNTTTTTNNNNQSINLKPNNHFNNIIYNHCNNNNNISSTDLNSELSNNLEPQSGEVSLKINATNVWFGSARTTPVNPITIDKQGFIITCHNSFLKKNNGKFRSNYNKKDLVSFLIKPEDIISCCAYLGNQRKHTIFLFLLPNCIRNLKSNLKNTAATSEHFSLFCDSSLIAIFTPFLSQCKISQLVYLMWCYGKKSIFGPSIYSEIDQKSALCLLSNIKPAISLTKLLEYKNVPQSSSSLPSLSSPTTSTTLTNSAKNSNVKHNSNSSCNSHTNIHNGNIDDVCDKRDDLEEDKSSLKIIVDNCNSVVNKFDFEQIMNSEGISKMDDDGEDDMHIEEITLTDLQLKQEPQDILSEEELVEINYDDDDYKSVINNVHNTDNAQKSTNVNYKNVIIHEINNGDLNTSLNIKVDNDNITNDDNTDADNATCITTNNNNYDNVADGKFITANEELGDDDDDTNTNSQHTSKMHKRPRILSRRRKRRKVNNGANKSCSNNIISSNCNKDDTSDVSCSNVNNNKNNLNSNNNCIETSLNSNTYNNCKRIKYGMIDENVKNNKNNNNNKNKNNNANNDDSNIGDKHNNESNPPNVNNQVANNNNNNKNDDFTIVTWPVTDDNHHNARNNNVNSNTPGSDINKNNGDDGNNTDDYETEDAFSNNSDVCDLEIVAPNESDLEAKVADDELMNLNEEAKGDVLVTGGRPPIKCPITQCLMQRPVRNKFCGHSYDCKGVQQLIQMRGSKAKCPVPGCANVKPLEMQHLEEDVRIKKLLKI